MTPDQEHHGERGLGDQIARYRTAFISVVAMVVMALFVGGYILSNERLSLPSWVPVLGKEYVTLKADFRTAQAVTPGQGQAVTIAGAKIGEIASVQSNEGDALVTMNITPKYARYIYRDATMLLRPKTGLKDMTVEVDPGTPSAGRVPSGYTMSQSQTAPDVNFEEFLASARRRNARLPAGADRRSGRRSEGQLGQPVGDLQALRPDLPVRPQDHRPAAVAPQEHRKGDPQLPADRQRARRQGHRNLAGDRRLQRGLPDLRRAGPELPADAAPAARHAFQDQERARQAGHGDASWPTRP